MQQFSPEQLAQIKMQQEEAEYQAKVVAFKCTKNGRVFPYSATLFKHRVKMKLTPLLEMPEELSVDGEKASAEPKAKTVTTSRRAKVEQAE